MKEALQKLRRWRRHNRAVREADAVVVSYPKCGRTWLLVLLSNYMAAAYDLPKGQLLKFDNFKKQNSDAPSIFFTHERRRFTYLSSHLCRPDRLPSEKSMFRNKRLIFLTRDPLDAIVSLYFHRRYRDCDYHGTLQAFVDEPAGGLDTLLSYYLDWAKILPGMNSALQVRYEDLHQEPIATFGEIVRFLQLPFDGAAVESAVEESSFEKMRSAERSAAFDAKRLRTPDANEPNAYKVRSGKVGGHEDHLSAAEISRLNERVRETLGGLFGYGETGQEQSSTSALREASSARRRA